MVTYNGVEIGGSQTTKSTAQNVINDIAASSVNKSKKKKKKHSSSSSSVPVEQYSTPATPPPPPVTINDIIAPPKQEPVTAVVNQNNEIVGVEDPNKNMSRLPTQEEKREYEIQTKTTTTEQRIGASLQEDIRNTPAEDVITQSSSVGGKSINTANPKLRDDITLTGGTINRDGFVNAPNLDSYTLEQKSFSKDTPIISQEEAKGITASGILQTAVIQPAKAVGKTTIFAGATLATGVQYPFVSRETTMLNLRAMERLRPSNAQIATTAFIGAGGFGVGRIVQAGYITGTTAFSLSTIKRQESRKSLISTGGMIAAGVGVNLATRGAIKGYRAIETKLGYPKYETFFVSRTQAANLIGDKNPVAFTRQRMYAVTTQRNLIGEKTYLTAGESVVRISNPNNKLFSYKSVSQIATQKTNYDVLTTKRISEKARPFLDVQTGTGYADETGVGFFAVGGSQQVKVGKGVKQVGEVNKYSTGGVAIKQGENYYKTTGRVIRIDKDTLQKSGRGTLFGVSRTNVVPKDYYAIDKEYTLSSKQVQVKGNYAQQVKTSSFLSAAQTSAISLSQSVVKPIGKLNINLKSPTQQTQVKNEYPTIVGGTGASSMYQGLNTYEYTNAVLSTSVISGFKTTPSSSGSVRTNIASIQTNIQTNEFNPIQNIKSTQLPITQIPITKYNQETRLGNNLITIPAVFSETKYNQKQRYGLNLKQGQLQSTAYKMPVRQISRGFNVPRPPTKPFIPIIPFGLSLSIPQSSSQSSRIPTTNLGYMPSFSALAFGITGRYKRSRFTGTGLDLRPISGFKVKA